ncbi:MAG TPA: GGDEF domain-containing protein [Vitreimonas sp.]|uniref:GGDEF domain-containing protein n=1 Tax=Vitreimonas sp. TaxID=3069702 RepID=UPI002D36419F|nr:GGDEF domain-containing protein [Vitreimonas sp.]HYD85837.1 GGDEF domain-containing protein [Vitreimonas sp.]
MTEQETLMKGPGGEAVAQETLDLMRLHGVPPTSDNYEVWLAYRLGRNAALREAIDSRIAGGDSFTSEFNAQIHERFFTGLGASAQILLTGEQIARDLGQVLSLLKQTEEKSGSYGRTLESAATDLNSGLGPDQIRQVVSSLAAATLDMASHNQQLNQQLQRSSREIETLRASLESVRVESLTDSLTGLANRRMFDETLRMRIDEARAQRTEICLLLCDIDHFKRFNDTWGHHTGDQILRFLASALQAHARPDFLVARHGGEEFAVIMPRVNARIAAQTAEALRAAIQAKRLRRRSTNEDLGQVTVSVGIARLQPGDTPQGLVERADACLYASKRNGRNQVTTDATPVLYVA